jgi:hypothetical protein
MTARDDSSSMLPLGGIVHYLALLFIVTPAADFIANVAPFQFGDAHWRYGTVGLLSGFLLTPLLGLLISTVAAQLLAQPRMQMFLGIFNLTAAILLSLALVFFVLDVLEVRHSVPTEAHPTFDVGSLKALGKHLTVVPALLWLGVVNLRLRRKNRERGVRPGDTLVTGRLKSQEKTGS